MSGHILDFARSPHRNAQELLPWYLAGTLDEDQDAAVELHVRGCAACRAELQEQRHLREALAHEPAPEGVEAALSRMHARQDEPHGARERLFVPALRQAQGLLSGARRWTGFALAAQVGIIAVLSWALLQREAPREQYRTLSTPAVPGAAAPNLVVMFAPQLREEELRRILRQAGARVVGGPTVAGGYLLSVDPADQAAALQYLQSQKDVRLAESLGARAVP